MDLSQLQHIDIPLPLVLAIMATLGYVFGTLPARRRNAVDDVTLQMEKDLSRAKNAIHELGKVVREIRSASAKHQSRIKLFQRRLAKLGTRKKELAWHDLCQEVEAILDPTLHLVNEIANAQERIRYQSNYLLTFSEVRTDPLTGLGNRRALEHVLDTQFGILKRYGKSFSLAVIDIDHFKELNDQYGHLYGDKILCDLTGVLTDVLRTVDILARYGGDELVVVMPQTETAGAELAAERLRSAVEQRMPFTVSIGVASATESDTPEVLFQRADSALYAAKTSGRNRVVTDQAKPEDRAVGPESSDVTIGCPT